MTRLRGRVEVGEAAARVEKRVRSATLFPPLLVLREQRIFFGLPSQLMSTACSDLMADITGACVLGATLCLSVFAYLRTLCPCSRDDRRSRSSRRWTSKCRHGCKDSRCTAENTKKVITMVVCAAFITDIARSLSLSLSLSRLLPSVRVCACACVWYTYLRHTN